MRLIYAILFLVMACFNATAITDATNPAIKRPYFPYLFLYLWKSVYSLESVIFKTGLCSDPRFPNMPIWWQQNGLFILYSLRCSVLPVAQALEGCIVPYVQQQPPSNSSRPQSPCLRCFPLWPEYWSCQEAGIYLFILWQNIQNITYTFLSVQFRGIKYIYQAV